MKRQYLRRILTLILIATLILLLVFLLTSAHLRFLMTNNAVAPRRIAVIIDAGHGGEDGGAISLTGQKESEINLAISSKLEQLLSFWGTDVIMTRTTEALTYSKNADTVRKKKAEDQNRRIKIISETSNAVLISIHQNTYPDSAPFGAQVLFADTAGSRDFALAMQMQLKNTLNSDNKRAPVPVAKNILLFNHISRPALLIECGFISNPREEQLLLNPAYQLKLTQSIAACYLTKEQSLRDVIYGGNNEGQINVFLH